MHPSIARKTTWAAMMGAALFLGACVTSNESSGPFVDPEFKDAKVDAQVAGKTLQGGFDQGKDWNSAVTAPTGLDALTGVSTQLNGFKKTAALPKTADFGGTLMVNLDDTAKGYATVYSESIGLLSHTIDTAIVKWDDKAKDTIKNNENIIRAKHIEIDLGGKTTTTEFTDGDGDGQVTPVPGKDNKAKLTVIVSDQGTVQQTVLLVGAGPDANFDNDSDNTVLQADWTKTKNGQVIASGAFIDSDGDGIVTDNSKDCIVIAKYSAIDPDDKPLVHQADFEAKVKVLAHKAGNVPMTLHYQETLKNGRVNTVSMKNREGGDEIVKNDTMTVHLETTVAAADDTLKHATADFVMNLGNDLNSDSDDVCYAIHVTAEKKFGLEREAEFNFYPDKPIPHGQTPTAGSFDGKATYANGQSISLKGSFSPTGFDVQYTGPEGHTVEVKFSLGGDLTSNP